MKELTSFRKYITEDIIKDNNPIVNQIIDILQGYVIDEVGETRPYISEDSIEQIATEIGKISINLYKT
jgi:hypothetical protein